MNDLTTHFNAKYEDLAIIIRKLQIEYFDELPVAVSAEPVALTRIVLDNLPVGMNMTYNSKELTGEFHIIFKNQKGNEKSELIMWVAFSITTHDKLSKSANMFCKFIQYLFGFTNDYVRSENVVDKDGELFVLPEFLYSTASFENDFID